MTKKYISIALIVLAVIANAYLIWRINSNTMSIASYDAGISQRTGIGKMESYWTSYIGGSKNSAFSAEDRANAESDSTYSIIGLVLLDIAVLGGLYALNKKPKPAPAPIEDDDWAPRRPRRRR